VFNICIIGLGNIGFRHLQSLENYAKKINFYLIDNNNTRIKILKNEKKKLNHNYYYYKSIKDLDSKLKFKILIMATNSNVRLKLTREIISNNNIEYIIFEKIVTFKIIEYKKLLSLINKKKIKAFVNFPLREFKFINYIKQKVKKNSSLTIIASYKKINIASNLIHYLDLFQFLKKTKNFKVSYEKLHKRIYRSKRKGFIEFKGDLNILNKQKDYVYVSENKNNFDFLLIKINETVFLIFENESRYIEINLINLNIFKRNYKHHLQSELTLKYFEKLISNKKINLTTLDEALYTHKLIINIFNKHMKKVSRNSKLLIT